MEGDSSANHHPYYFASHRAESPEDQWTQIRPRYREQGERHARGGEATSNSICCISHRYNRPHARLFQMPNSKLTNARKRTLGTKPPITRRDFIGSTLLASGSVLLRNASPVDLIKNRDELTGYGGVGEYSSSNGNTLEVLQAGHTIRDHIYEPVPKNVIETGENYACVIVGGGISGLAAALFF